MLGLADEDEVLADEGELLAGTSEENRKRALWQFYSTGMLTHSHSDGEFPIYSQGECRVDGTRCGPRHATPCGGSIFIREGRSTCSGKSEGQIKKDMEREADGVNERR